MGGRRGGRKNEVKDEGEEEEKGRKGVESG